jgi:23S rRNA pseudouridine2604 synthase
MNEPIRLAKRVVDLARCSRREAEHYIEGGWVLVDGVVVEEPQFKVTNQVVSLHAEARPEAVEPATILLHAPPGFDAPAGAALPAPWFSADTRAPEDDSGMRMLKRHATHLSAPLPLEVGASGLLVFTQDRRIVRRLVEDAEKIEQEYIVEVSGRIADDGLQRINRGLAMNGRTLARVKVSWQNEVRLRFAMMHARPGQIRHLCAEVGLGIVAMKRIRIARVAMAKMQPGQWRYLPGYERF